MRIIPAPEAGPAQRLLTEIEDALGYADHVLGQPRSSEERRGAARRLKDLAQAMRVLVEQSSTEAVVESVRHQTVSPIAYELALLRGSAPAPRPLSLVKADPMALLPGSRGCHGAREAFRSAATLLFLGEHPNMPHHGAVQDVATGRLYVGVHLNELVELNADEV